MFRADHATRLVDANGSGKDGYGSGDPGVTPATVVTADALNSIQEELCRAIEACGVTLDKTKQDQFAKAACLPMVADYSVAGIGVASGGKFDLTQLAADAGFTLASNEITLPTTGIYVISFSALVACSLTTNPRTVDVEVSDGSGSFYGMVNTRFSASASDGVLVAATWFGRCTNTSNHVKVVSAVSNLSIIAGGDGEGRLSIHRLRQSA